MEKTATKRSSTGNNPAPRIQRAITHARGWAELSAYSEHDAGRKYATVQKHFADWAKMNVDTLAHFTPAERQQVKLAFADAYVKEAKAAAKKQNPGSMVLAYNVSLFPTKELNGTPVRVGSGRSVKILDSSHSKASSKKDKFGNRIKTPGATRHLIEVDNYGQPLYGWVDADAIVGSNVNPAKSAAQYRLAQAVIAGTSTSSMPVKVAREIVKKTPAGMRSEYAHNPKGVAAMSAAEINKALDRLGVESSKITDEFIAAGRGNERPSEIRYMTDPLARRWQDNARKHMELRIEVERRMGPSASSRLPKGFGPLKSNPAGGRRRKSNPMTDADAMFESFHGTPPTETVEFIDELHVHHNLAACGDLIGFKLITQSEYDATLEFTGVILCTNESGTHMYLRGGDQCLDLDALKIPDTGKESVIVGQVWCVAYETEKEFDNFEPIQYVHLLGDEKFYRGVRQGKDLWEEAQPPKPGAFTGGNLPTLRYSTVDQLLYLDGGVYKIVRPLVGTSVGIEG